jgi:hypothetical protein
MVKGSAKKKGSTRVPIDRVKARSLGAGDAVRGVNQIAAQPRSMMGHDGQQSAQIVQNLLDPCHSPMRPFPDEWHGKVEMIRTTTRTTVGVDAGFNRHVAVFPCPQDGIGLSGAVTYATFTYTDDPQLTNMVSDYKFIRCVGMCASLIKRSAATTADGAAFVGCFPDYHGSDFPNVTASVNAVSQNGGKQLKSADGVELAWCPRSQYDYTPYDPNLAINSTTNLDELGRKLDRRPALHFVITGGGSGTEYEIVVTRIYECFLVPSKQIRGIMSHTQNARAVDGALSILPSLKFERIGDSIDKVGGYAGKVAKLLGQPAVAAALTSGSSAVAAAVRSLA